MAYRLTAQVRDIALVTTAVAQGRPVAQGHRACGRRDAGAEEHRQHDGGPALLVLLRGDPGRPRGGHRGRAGRPGAGAGRGRGVEGPHRLGEPDGRQPDRPGARDRAGHDGGRQRRPVAEDHRQRARRGRAARRDDQRDDRDAADLRRRGDPGRQRGRRRGAARRAGAGAGCGGHVEGPDGLGQHGLPQPDRPGAGHRAGDDGGGERRPVAEGHGGRRRRDAGAEEHRQHDGRPAVGLRRRGDAGGPRGRRRGRAGRSGAGAGCGGHVEGPHGLGQHGVPQPHRPGPQHRPGDDGGGQRRPVAEGHGRRLRRDARAEEHREHDGGPAVSLRRPGDADGPGRGHRGPARRPGPGGRRVAAPGRT